MGIEDEDLVLRVDTVWHDDLDHHACIRWICREPTFQMAIYDPPVTLSNIAGDGLQHARDDDGNCRHALALGEDVFPLIIRERRHEASGVVDESGGTLEPLGELPADCFLHWIIVSPVLNNPLPTVVGLRHRWWR